MEILTLPKKLERQSKSYPDVLTSGKIEEDQERRLRDWNDLEGNLSGLDCAVCKNRGYMHVIRGSEIVAADCVCMAKRRAIRQMEQNGLRAMWERFTFSGYQTAAKWQKAALECVQTFSTNPSGQWLFIGGKVGAGKSHLCIAACAEIINAGTEVRYMLWRDDARKLKSLVNEPEYDDEIRRLKIVPVLYIDDFFKAGVRSVAAKPDISAADINLAFEILNHRYNAEKTTIISSELSVEDIIAIDEAVGSRIFEKSRGNYLFFGEKTENWRLRA